MTPPELSRRAEEFRGELETSLSVFCGRSVSLAASDSERGDRISIRTQELIPLVVEGAAAQDVLLGIELEYQCFLSESHRYLTVESSTVKVWPLAKTRGEPLFRYDFEKHSSPDVPCSHVQVHAHRDAFTHLLGHSGERSRRARRRSRRSLDDKIPAVSEFHFTTGGERFRPCLEDILETLRNEFGLDVDMNRWKPRLGQARITWRRTQLKAAIRDSPRTAARVLEEMYDIEIPIPESEADRRDRLTKS